LEDANQPGGVAMSKTPNPKEKIEEESQQDIRKGQEYRKFLKQVIKAPNETITEHRALRLK
jgi:hypothetical protein